MSLANKTTTGILWNFTEQMSTRGIGIVISLLLARFLVPADFGLVAMMEIFIAVAGTLMDSGFKQALIRKQGASQDDFNTVFYTNLALGCLAYLLLFSAAPFIADFYEEKRLTGLIRVAGIAILIGSFQVVQSAILNRTLNFKVQLKATVPASVVSGFIAVLLAYIGWGVWALVAKMLISAFLVTVFIWSMKLWQPTLTFSRQSLNDMFGFGSKLFLSGLLDTVFKNMYVVVIAKIFSATVAGYYFFANNIKNLIIDQLVSSISTVTYPALATMQHDNVILKAGYRKVIQMTTFLLFPAMVFMAALAEPLFLLILHERWLPAVPYLQLMCIAGLLYPLHSINLNILKVKGRSDLFLNLEILKKISIVLILFVSVQYGVIGILIGQIIGSVLAYLPNSYFSNELIGYSVREQIGDFLPGLVLSGAIAVMVYVAVSVSTLPALAELIVFGIAATMLYLLGARALKLQAFTMTLQMVKERINV
ncbi:Teichuronic acid biosynthesis protein TuaB [Methanosarcinales archaeon]|nr:Teichuronic acid biosynthesis protein TuaB [Methanosarcinales archaeon]